MNKSKCAYPGEKPCTDRVVKIVGDCKFCEKKFCGRHRTVEAHMCPNIEKCRQAHFQKNSDKLTNEKTSANKLQQAM